MGSWHETTGCHRCLQAQAYLGIAQVISNHAYSYHEDRTCGHQHIAYCACTDVHIVYSVVTKYTFRNCASNAVQPSLARVPTQLCRCLCWLLTFAWLHTWPLQSQLQSRLASWTFPSCSTPSHTQGAAILPFECWGSLPFSFSAFLCEL